MEEIYRCWDAAVDCEVPRCRSRLEVPTSAMGTRGDVDERMRLLENTQEQ